MTDTIPGNNMVMAFKNPTNGFNCAIIRDLEDNFLLIAEDWSPVNASTHAWVTSNVINIKFSNQII